MLHARVSMMVAQYIIGHATEATQGAYVPEASPVASPLWPALKEAIATLPDHRDWVHPDERKNVEAAVEVEVEEPVEEPVVDNVLPLRRDVQPKAQPEVVRRRNGHVVRVVGRESTRPYDRH